MYVERLLQINVATLAALGTLLLGMGQRSETLSLLMLVAAVTSVWLTDFTGWFRLSRKVANAAAVVAVAVSLPELWYYRGDVQILGIGPVLSYLQIILLLQKKDVRIYWQLIVLSLLQVVVAAAFSQGVGFGAMLVVYMLVGFSALALLLLHRQGSRHRRTGTMPPSPPAVGGRWPLAGQEAHFSGVPGGRGRAGICGELFVRLAGMALGTLVLTSLLFFIVPRFGRPAWQGARPDAVKLVGFSDRVILGELGPILESPRPVMRVELFDGESPDRHYRARDELYLRGAILTYYDNGQWEDRTSPRKGDGALFRANAAPALAVSQRKNAPSPFVGRDRLVRQRITLEPLDRDELFCLWPFVTTEATGDLRFVGQRLLRPRHGSSKRFRIELGTAAFVNGIQTPITPLESFDTPDDVQRLLQLPELPKLTAMADSWIRQSGLPAGDRIARARMLKRKFHDPSRFQYSLEGRARDLSIDAIEDFVADNPRGHCEYFATALALMLRSQGIPSRVVVGYKCGEFDDLGHFYQVRQLHAHTWVEAYLQPQHLPRELLDGDRSGRWAAGGWLRLEPTPASADAGWADAGGSLLGQVEGALRWFESLWADYVMEMDRQRQREAVYQPAVRFVRDLLSRLSDPDWWRGLIARIGHAMNVAEWSVSNWLRLAVILTVGLPLLWLGGRRLGRVLRRLRARLTGRAAAAGGGHAAEVEFYPRLEAQMARHGLLRSPAQTHRDFAVAAGTQLAVATGRPELTSLPTVVVEAFYRVRFGRLPLDSPQTQAVEHALQELAACGFADPAACGFAKRTNQ